MPDDVRDEMAKDLANGPTFKAEVPVRSKPGQAFGAVPKDEAPGRWKSERGLFGRRKTSKKDLGSETAAFAANPDLMAKAMHGRLKDRGVDASGAEVRATLEGLRKDPAPIKDERINSRLNTLNRGLEARRNDAKAHARRVGRLAVESGRWAERNEPESTPSQPKAPASRNPFFGKAKAKPAATRAERANPADAPRQLVVRRAPSQGAASVEPQPRRPVEPAFAAPPVEAAARQSGRTSRLFSWGSRTLSVGTSRGRDHWREFRSLWSSSGFSLGANLTFFGRMLIRVPAGLPAMAVAVFVIGVASLAAGFVTTDQDMGLSAYAVHTVGAVLASVANLVILLANALIAGITGFFKVFILSAIVSANGLLQAVFRALYDAVNALIAFTHLGSPLAPPQIFDESKVEARAPIHLSYLAPAASHDCGQGLISLVNVVDKEVVCSPSFVQTKPFLGDLHELFIIPEAPHFNQLPQIVWDGLTSMYNATQHGVDDFFTWLGKQAGGIF